MLSGAIRPGSAEILARSLRGTVTTTAAHRGLGSPFPAANWLAIAVSREIADLGTVTPPDCREDEQLARLSTAMSGSMAKRTRDRVASLIVHAAFRRSHYSSAIVRQTAARAALASARGCCSRQLTRPAVHR